MHYSDHLSEMASKLIQVYCKKPQKVNPGYVWEVFYNPQTMVSMVIILSAPIQTWMIVFRSLELMSETVVCTSFLKGRSKMKNRPFQHVLTVSSCIWRTRKAQNTHFCHPRGQSIKFQPAMGRV